MQCYICDGNVAKVQKDVETTRKGKKGTFKDINVCVCESSCGEEVYEPDDVDAMQYFIERTIKNNEYPEITNVEELADYFRVSSKTISNMFRAVKLPAV